MVLACGQVRNQEVAVRGKNGQMPQLLVSADAIQLDSGLCMLLIALDVTERKSLEERLRHSQKMEAVVQLAGGLAHNFNNILSVIQANASLLKVRETLSARGSESMELLLRSTAQGTAIVRQMLTLSRNQPIQPTVLDLNDIITASMPLFRHTLGDRIALDLACASPLPAIVGDRALLDQVLLNLVVNARDAMPDGGQLTISTCARTFERLPPAARAATGGSRYVCLSVQDTGEGIPAQNLPRIFEPFFTTKKPGKGTGLGLATLHAVIQQHRGWVEVQSEVGLGSTFHVFLPAAEEGQPLS
jgi:signal transduction histidine kinase